MGQDSLQHKKEKAISESRVMISLVTSKYLESYSCKQEVKTSKSNIVPIIPVQLSDSFEWPPEGPMENVFKFSKCIDLSDDLYLSVGQMWKGKHFKDLLKCIQEYAPDLPSKPQPTSKIVKNQSTTKPEKESKAQKAQSTNSPSELQKKPEMLTKPSIQVNIQDEEESQIFTFQQTEQQHLAKESIEGQKDLKPSASAPKHDHNPSISAPKQELTPSTSAPKQDNKPSISAPKQDNKPPTSAPKQDNKPSTSAPKQELITSTSAPKQDNKPSTSAPKQDNKPSTPAPKQNQQDTKLPHQYQNIYAASVSKILFMQHILTYEHILTPYEFILCFYFKIV